MGFARLPSNEYSLRALDEEHRAGDLPLARSHAHAGGNWPRVSGEPRQREMAGVVVGAG